MLFKIHYKVPANTSKAAPSFQKLSIAKGRITQWLIQMPVECADLMQFRVEYHNTQILPFSGSTWMYGIFEPTVLHDNILINDGPYNLDVYAFNLDTRHSHEYNIYCNIEPSTPVTPGMETAGMWDKIKGFIGVD